MAGVAAGCRPVLVDGGICSGLGIREGLAADAVCVLIGRSPPGGGAVAGDDRELRSPREKLVTAMLLSGCATSTDAVPLLIV
jgi:isopentenyl diphosphate isomerase/L-lactate dehydrogenase-like FMN-dependent dehydrogenase